MKQRSVVLLLLLLVVGLLVGLNAASYTQKQKEPDNEAYANRSSYNPGSTGTEAWYSLLAETGNKVIRWQDPMSSLLTVKTAPSVFVIVGYARKEVTDKDAEAILQWVARGGRLILFYRHAPEQLAVTTSDWEVTLRSSGNEALTTVDPANPQEMTRGVEAIRPTQPSTYTQGVNAVQFSRFGENIKVAHVTAETKKAKEENSPTSDAEFRPPPRPSGGYQPNETMTGPVVHFAKADANYVVEVPYQSGRIVFVSDPYIVSNGGISLADNAKLAANLVAANGGSIAFDEYHQGYSSGENQFVQFFAGTPVVAVFFQALVLVGVVFYSQSRRFARPVPEPEPDRLSKLEYVSAMAELQQRTHAWDLAIENIYGDFKRQAARLFGLDVKAATDDVLAKRVADRTGMDAVELGKTFFACEEIIRGERTNRAETIRLTATIREVQNKLSIRRGSGSR